MNVCISNMYLTPGVVHSVCWCMYVRTFEAHTAHVWCVCMYPSWCPRALYECTCILYICVAWVGVYVGVAVC